MGKLKLFQHIFIIIIIQGFQIKPPCLVERMQALDLDQVRNPNPIIL